jgi:hypothetical protein
MFARRPATLKFLLVSWCASIFYDIGPILSATFQFIIRTSFRIQCCVPSVNEDSALNDVKQVPARQISN